MSDSQDEIDQFHSQRDKLLLGSLLHSRQDSDSDAPLHALDMSSSDYSDADDAPQSAAAADSDDSFDMDEFEREEALLHNITRNLPQKSGNSDDDDDDDNSSLDGEQTAMDKEGWGSSARAYYDADQDSQDEELEMEEQAEALRIQRQRLQDMNADDFVDDSFASKLTTSTSSAKNAKQKRVQVQDTLPESEKLRLLKSRAPELENLLQEFTTRSAELELLQPVFTRLNDQDNSANAQLYRLKYQLLSAYLTNVAFYLHLRALPVVDASLALMGRVTSHPCLGVILDIQEKLEQIDLVFDTGIHQDERITMDRQKADMQDGNDSIVDEDVNDNSVDEDDHDNSVEEMEDGSDNSANEMENGSDNSANEMENDNEKSIDEMQDDIQDMESRVSIQSDTSISHSESGVEYDEEATLRDPEEQGAAASDEEEEAGLPSIEQVKRMMETSAAKTSSKKRTRKNQRQKGFSVDAGSQEINIEVHAPPEINSIQEEAVKLQESDQEPEREFNPDELEALEYYESIKTRKNQAKEERKAAFAPMQSEDTLPASLEEEQGEDGDAKRPASWQILSNKGLTPYRKKENRNPRVKRRKKFEKAVKKLHTFKRVPADRRTLGSYAGESTGIKTHLARSTKL